MPITNSTAIVPTPVLISPEICDTTPTKVVHEGRTLTADIQGQVLACLLRRNNLRKRPGQRLNTALNMPTHRQHPELPPMRQKDGEDGNAKVSEDADDDQFSVAYLLARRPNRIAKGNAYNLGYQKGQQKSGSVKSQR